MSTPYIQILGSHSNIQWKEPELFGRTVDPTKGTGNIQDELRAFIVPKNKKVVTLPHSTNQVHNDGDLSESQKVLTELPMARVGAAWATNKNNPKYK
jgi:hypothetical protein